MREAGEAAPDFLARDQTGAVRRFDRLRAGAWTVLYFYPRDGTPGCTAEACAFRDAWDRFAEAGVRVVGVSTDSPEDHARFAEEHELPFVLLSDPGGEVLARYGVPSMLGLAARVSFLIDDRGVIVAVYRDVDPGLHVEEILEDREALGPSGAVTPRGEAPKRVAAALPKEAAARLELPNQRGIKRAEPPGTGSESSSQVEYRSRLTSLLRRPPAPRGD
jgi:peroxiredoxin Q/BCP